MIIYVLGLLVHDFYKLQCIHYYQIFFNIVNLSSAHLFMYELCKYMICKYIHVYYFFNIILYMFELVIASSYLFNIICIYMNKIKSGYILTDIFLFVNFQTKKKKTYVIY